MTIVSTLTWSWEKWNHCSSEDKGQGRHTGDLVLVNIISIKIGISEGFFDALELGRCIVQLKAQPLQCGHTAEVRVLSLRLTAWDAQEFSLPSQRPENLFLSLFPRPESGQVQYADIQSSGALFGLLELKWSHTVNCWFWLKINWH